MSIKRFIPLIVIIILMLLGWYFEIQKYISFETIKENRQFLVDYVKEHYILAPLILIGTYAAVTALSLPIAVYLTLLSGFLFPQPFATIFVVTGATIGACVLFLVATTALGDSLKKRAGPFLNKMRAGFQENAVSYLLFLRLVPLFPFWLVNIAPAFMGVSFFTFFWTTALGIIPGAFVYAQVGTGLGAIFDSGEEFSISALLNPQIKLAFIALGIFVMIPTFYRMWKKRKMNKDTNHNDRDLP